MSERKALPLQTRLAELAGINVEQRTAEMVWSTGAAVDRTDWWTGERYVEELSLDPKHVDMTRLNAGAPLLNTHNRYDLGDVIGVVEKASVDGKEGRATVRFSSRAEVDPIWRDVQDGIIRNVSVGYAVREYEITRTKGKPDLYRAVDWQPMELSLVPIGADAAAGLRAEGAAPSRTYPCEFRTLSAAAETTIRKEQTMHDETTPAAPDQAAQTEAELRAATAAADAERRRTAEILRIGRDFARFGAQEIAARAVEDPAATPDSVRQQILAHMRDSQAPTVARPEPANVPPSYGMGAREMLHSGSLHAFRGVGARIGGTMSDEQCAYRAGQWVRAALFGDPQAARWCRDAGVELRQGTPDMFGFAQQRDLVEASFTSAGYLVPVEMEAAIISNREQYGIARTICRVVPMTATSIQIPRITADMTAYFTTEGSDGTASDPTGDQVTLTLKDLMAYTKIGKSTAQSTIVGLAEMVADEQARAFAVKEDACLTVGDGTSTYGGIRGCVTLLELAAYAGGRATTASGHDTFPELDATDIAKAVGKLPVYARAGANWLCSGMFEATVFGRLRMSAGGNDNPTLSSPIFGAPYAGFRVGIAHTMPADDTADLTNKIFALLGNFRLGVAIGSGVGMMLTVDPYTLAHQNLTRIISVERFDLVAHGVNNSTTVAGPIVGIFGNS